MTKHFESVKFATTVTIAILECVKSRGLPISEAMIKPHILEMISDFTDDVEDVVNEQVEKIITASAAPVSERQADPSLN